MNDDDGDGDYKIRNYGYVKKKMMMIIITTSSGAL